MKQSSMTIDEHPNLKSENAEPYDMRDEDEAMYRGGRKEDTCDGMSTRSLTIKHLTGGTGE